MNSDVMNGTYMESDR